MDIVKQMSDEVTDNDSLSSVQSGIGLLKNIEKELLNNNIYHGRYSKHNDLNFHIVRKANGLRSFENIFKDFIKSNLCIPLSRFR